MNDGSLARYARAIERRWTEFLGRPAVLSPSDWRWISEWHDRGISLQLILECLEAAEERRRDGHGAKNPRGLSYLAAAVNESWSVILEGRTQVAADVRSPGSHEPLENWRRRFDEEPAGSALKVLLESLLADLDAGAWPEDVDQRLERRLRKVVPAALREAAESEARTWLECHRSKMTEKEFDNAFRRAVTVRLRRRLQLPLLAP